MSEAWESYKKGAIKELHEVEELLEKIKSGEYEREYKQSVAAYYRSYDELAVMRKIKQLLVTTRIAVDMFECEEGAWKKYSRLGKNDT